MQKPKSSIDIFGFSGMNNVKRVEDFFSADGIAEPRVILNADVDITQHLVVREGVQKVIDLANVHSLWGGLSCMLCVADDVLYRIEQDTAVVIGALGSRGESVSYVEEQDKVYISNKYCSGKFTPANNTLTDWGVYPPCGPMLLTGSGSLLPGVYNVVMTMTGADGELSGTGPIATIELVEGVGSGIQVINRPNGATVWCTDVNEYIFYRVGEVNKITSIPTVEPCPSLFCAPPPFLSNLCYAFGRIWGSVGKTLYYSEPFKLSWFRTTTNKFEFESDITLIAKVSTGLFVGMKDKTKFLEGTEPEVIKQIDAGAGSVQGTLAYCNNVPYLADVLGTQEKGYVDVPIWVTAEGIVIGNANGRLFNLTKNKIKFGVPDKGASLYRNQNGVFQFLSSFRKGTTGSGAGFSDDATCEIFRNGKII